MIKMEKNEIKIIMKKHPELKEKLFARGFFITDANVNCSEYPFYGEWSKVEIGNIRCFLQSEQKCFTMSEGRTTLLLIGHAYNPFTLCFEEQSILKSLVKKEFPSELFWSEFNQLTGVFTLVIIINQKLYLVGDPTCMQTTFYCTKEDKIFVSSHTNLLGDLLDLEWDDYVRRLSDYRFFPLLGNALPGDLTQFKKVKRLVPNHYVILNKNESVSKRFFYPESMKLNVNDVVDKSSEIIQNNLKLIAKKWKRPAISMTGGCDSKTTLACVNGEYDKFSYFSYISSKSEEVDAKAARKICNALGLKHTIYTISENDSVYENIESIRKILEWNSGGIIPVNKNDVRKRAFFASINDFDVEVKSWASEIGRSYYSKRFNERKNFGDTPTPRKCTTMYKFFLNNRQLVHQTDTVFENYLEKYFEQAKENPIAWQEQFFWEYRVPSWNGLVITGEHRYSFDITIPYNNRILLQLLLSVPIEMRIKDCVYERIRQKMSPLIEQTGVAVTNLKHTKNREKMENIYYMIHSKVHF